MDRSKIHNTYTTTFFCFLFLVTIPTACATNKTCDPDNAPTATYGSGPSEQIDDQEKHRRMDPTFRKPQLTTPLLFAHRGGGLEAPESTKCAFKYAIEKAKADVLELDVQLTRDGKYVVWHGPGLDKLDINGIHANSPELSEDRKYIWEFDWSELDGQAWVKHPDANRTDSAPCNREDTELMLLSEFLQEFPNTPLNIEMKGSFKKKISNGNGLEDNVRGFFKILEQGQGERTIVVVSARHKIVKEFRKQSGERYPTNLSWFEQIYLRFSNKCLQNRVLETTYGKNYASRGTIEKVRRLGGSTYVFLTKFGPIPAIDKRPSIERDRIFEILDRGVDGIMTDRPEKLRQIIDEWINDRLLPQ
jgi:glycerophosphoryl diester phosphodiesterase